MPSKDNRGKHSGIMSASGQMATCAWIDLPQWPAREISPHKHAYRAVGMTLFDYVAIGALIALALWAGVLLYLRRKM
jgi:hypothetical protein